MAAEPTARDALIAEMLGDIGKLHDAVESLKGVLPEQIEGVETRITGLIGLLQKAGDAYKAQIEAYTNAQGEQIRTQMVKDASAAKVRFEQDASAAIKAALADVQRTIKASMQSDVAGPVQEAMQVQQKSLWKTLLLCLACGLIGGLVAVGVNMVSGDRQQDGYTALGKAVSASWNKLDAKTKALIEAERR